MALKTAQDLNEDDGITYVYDMLANVAFQRGEYKKAERLFTEVLNRSMNQKKLSENHNAVIDISLKLAKSFEVRLNLSTSYVLIQMLQNSFLISLDAR